MLSIKPIKSAAGAEKYYNAKDNYYLSDKESLDKASTWYGKGALKLGLSGIIEREAFVSLLKGSLPSGQQLGIKNADGSITHRPATDVTLSAPKSISLLGLVGGDERLIKAHESAVSKTLDAIEEQLAEARITQKGKIYFEKTQNLAIARFQHSSSRELDAQLHTHCLIMNMTERLDGNWRALSSKNKDSKEHEGHGFREGLYKNQHYYGLIYTSELAKQVVDLGYDIVIKDEYSNFDIEGLPQDYLEHSSKRRTHILSRLKELSLSSAKAAEKANLDLRTPKKSISSSDLKKTWLEDAKHFDIDLKEMIQNSKELKPGKIEIYPDLKPSLNAKEALNDALTHLSEFNTQIKHSSLIKEAFIFAVGQVSHQELETELKTKLEQGEILGLENKVYTSKALLEQEEKLMTQFKEKSQGFSLETPGKTLADKLLSAKNSVQLVDVQGLFAEKELLEELVQSTEEQGFRAFILHQGKIQTARFNQEIKRDDSSWKKWLLNCFKPNLAQTVAGFKHHYGEKVKAEKAKHDVIIVHDAQKLSYQDLSSLEDLSRKSQSKLILFNNTQSRAGFQPGNPITAIRQAGIKTHASELEKPEHEIEIHGTQKAKEDLTKFFATLSKEERQQTPVVALTNKDHQELSLSIRSQLQEQGEVSWHGRGIKVLGNEYLSPAQRKQLKFYEAGFQIKLNPFTEAQENWQIIGKDNKELIVEDKKGQQRKFSPSQLKEALVIKSKTLDVAPGDALKCQQDHYMGRFKLAQGQALTVTEIKEEGIVLSPDGKTKLYFSNQELQAMKLDYAYVQKPMELKEDVNQALVALQGYQINQNSLGEIAEFAKKVHVFTEDKDKAAQALEKEQIRFSIKEVIENQKKLIYRDADYAPKAIKTELEKLAQAFTKLVGVDIETPETFAAKALDYALAKLGEREAAMAHEDLLKEAVLAALGKAPMKEIERLLADKKEKGELIYADTYWITPKALEIEKQILANNKNEQNCLKPMVDKEVSLPEYLTAGQKSAVSLVLNTSDRFVSVQGLAGVGKTTMMQALQQKAGEAGFKVLGLAPMHTSKEELIANQINAQTIAQFLVEDKAYENETLFIVDESSMISNEDYLKIQEKIKSLNARGVFAGDITQLQSPSAGIPHELSIKTASQKKVVMSDIMRQNPNPVLKEGVIQAVNKNIQGSFEQLEKIKPEDHIERTKEERVNPEQKSHGSVIEIKCLDEKGKKIDYTPIYQAIAEDFLSRIPEQQQKTLIIAHAHEDRKIINALVREGLKEKGQIDAIETDCIRLKNKSLTQAELLKADNFKVGEFLRFERNYSIAEKGSYLKIEGIDKEKNLLHCQSEDKQLYSVNPAKIALKSGMTVYETEEVALAAGDRIKLKLTQKSLGHIANQEYTIDKILEEKAILKKGEAYLSLDLKSLRDSHWDYAYSTTAFGAQGQTSDFVIALELEKRKRATTWRSHIIDVTRARKQVTVYTEDQQALTQRYLQFLGDKTSAWMTHALKLKTLESSEIIPVKNLKVEEKKNPQTQKPLKAFREGIYRFSRSLHNSMN